MRQFVLPDSWDGGSSCELAGRDARRLSSVLRLAPGDRFPALGPDGATYACAILSGDRDRLVLSVEPAARVPGADGYLPDIRASRTTGAGRDAASPAAGAAAPTLPSARPASASRPANPVPRLTLAVALLKGSKLDTVARAAAEAGVSTIVPLVTARSVPAEHSAGRLERLRRVVAEALGQSGSAAPTRVVEPVTVAGLCEGYPPVAGRRLCLFFHEAPLAQASIHRYCTDVPDEIIACVGPEGGFDEREVLALAAGGFLPAWLGPTVLRAETAAVFAVASLRIVCLERSSWSMTESSE